MRQTTGSATSDTEEHDSPSANKNNHPARVHKLSLSVCISEEESHEDWIHEEDRDIDVWSEETIVGSVCSEYIAVWEHEEKGPLKY